MHGAHLVHSIYVDSFVSLCFVETASPRLVDLLKELLLNQSMLYAMAQFHIFLLSYSFVFDAITLLLYLFVM